VYVSKWGNSLGIRIPVTVAKKVGFVEGTPVEIDVENNSIVIRRKSYSLQKLLSEIDTDNLHDEVETGEPAGREIW